MIIFNNIQKKQKPTPFFSKKEKSLCYAVGTRLSGRHRRNRMSDKQNAGHPNKAKNSSTIRLRKWNLIYKRHIFQQQKNSFSKRIRKTMKNICIRAGIHIQKGIDKMSSDSNGKSCDSIEKWKKKSFLANYRLPDERGPTDFFLYVTDIMNVIAYYFWMSTNDTVQSSELYIKNEWWAQNPKNTEHLELMQFQKIILSSIKTRMITLGFLGERFFAP